VVCWFNLKCSGLNINLFKKRKENAGCRTVKENQAQGNRFLSLVEANLCTKVAGRYHLIFTHELAGYKETRYSETM